MIQESAGVELSKINYRRRVTGRLPVRQGISTGPAGPGQAQKMAVCKFNRRIDTSAIARAMATRHAWLRLEKPFRGVPVCTPSLSHKPEIYEFLFLFCGCDMYLAGLLQQVEFIPKNRHQPRSVVLDNLQATASFRAA